MRNVAPQIDQTTGRWQMVTAPGRLRCLVPFCRRTTARPGIAEWICAKHWRQVDQRLRRFYGKVQRAYEAASVECGAIEAEGSECAKAHAGGVHVSIVRRYGVAADRRDRKLAQARRLWTRCRDQAVTRAGML